MKNWFAPGFLVVLALAAVLRLPQLRLRPLHNDESVNAIKFRALWNSNNYKYDPNEYHGPTLPYFTLPSALLSGSRQFNDFTEATFRLVTVIFGLGVVLLLLILTRDFGKAETWWASVFTALSPAMVYYSRDYIHETLLVFFTGLAGFSWWRHVRSGRIGWCVLAGMGLGWMWATKETFVFPVISLALAWACARFRADRAEAGRSSVKSIFIALIVALVTAVLFFTSFFANPPGIVDAIKSYVAWGHRAEGMSAHVHPWNFYFERLFFYHAPRGPLCSELLIGVLAVAGFVVAMMGKRTGIGNVHLTRLIAFYTAWMTLFYCIVPYKTPWCLLGFLQGMILLAGIGAAALLRCCNRPAAKAAMAVGLAAATAQLGWQTWRDNFGVDRQGVPYCDTAKNPYVYSQTTADIFRLMQTVDGLAAAAPSGYGTPIEVMSPESYWPLPWYLRRFDHAGYWDRIPDQPLAPIMIVAASLRAGFDERSAKTHLMAGYYELRPDVFFELYVSVDLWTKYIKTAPPDKD